MQPWRNPTQGPLSTLRGLATAGKALVVPTLHIPKNGPSCSGEMTTILGMPCLRRVPLFT